MTKHLEETARIGFGRGVSDFEEACTHLWDKTGQKYWWTDTNTKYASYDGWTMGQYVVGSIRDHLPESIVNFMDGMKGEIESIDTSFVTKSFPDIDKVINAFQKGKYEGVVEVVKEIHKQVKNVDKFLWLVQDKRKLTFGKVSKAFSYTSTLSTFNKALNDINAYKSAGFNSRTSQALAALRAFMGCVPVFGGFYGTMLDRLPAFFTRMKQGFQSRQQKILDHARLP